MTAKKDLPTADEAAASSVPIAYQGMSKEHAARVKAHEDHQEALRTGGGDTRVTPHPDDFGTPKVVWPLEQANVPVEVHKPGSHVVVHNKRPVAPPTGTATGVTPEQVSVGIDNRAALEGAMSVEEPQVVDVAKETVRNAEEVATKPATYKNPTIDKVK